MWLWICNERERELCEDGFALYTVMQQENVWLKNEYYSKSQPLSSVLQYAQLAVNLITDIYCNENRCLQRKVHIDWYCNIIYNLNLWTILHVPNDLHASVNLTGKSIKLFQNFQKVVISHRWYIQVYNIFLL